MVQVILKRAKAVRGEVRWWRGLNGVEIFPSVCKCLPKGACMGICMCTHVHGRPEVNFASVTFLGLFFETGLSLA